MAVEGRSLMSGSSLAPDDLLRELSGCLSAGTPAALATVVAGPGTGARMLLVEGRPPIGSLGSARLDRSVLRDARGDLAAGRTRTRHYGSQGQAAETGVEILIEAFAPPPRMLIFGAVDFTGALVQVAKVLGFRVAVCDARGAFVTAERFPGADELVVGWPQDVFAGLDTVLGPRDAVCVLTHEVRFDVPAVTTALQTDVGYIGLMGSRRTQEDRTARLVRAGVTPEQFGRLFGPIGIDIGAATPEETAISICAEFIALRSGRRVPHLRSTEAPIHLRPA